MVIKKEFKVLFLIKFSKNNYYHVEFLYSVGVIPLCFLNILEYNEGSWYPTEFATSLTVNEVDFRK